jgi:hypothetical protein
MQDRSNLIIELVEKEKLVKLQILMISNVSVFVDLHVAQNIILKIIIIVKRTTRKLRKVVTGK